MTDKNLVNFWEEASKRHKEEEQKELSKYNEINQRMWTNIKCKNFASEKATQAQHICRNLRGLGVFPLSQSSIMIDYGSGGVNLEIVKEVVKQLNENSKNEEFIIIDHEWNDDDHVDPLNNQVEIVRVSHMRL